MVGALALLVTSVGTCAATAATTTPATAAAPTVATNAGYAAPLPSPAIVAQGVSSANPAHLFRDRPWDFTHMREVFNAVALLPGDQAAVDAARTAGLAVVLEFDYKGDFFNGMDISSKVMAVVDQVRSHPGTISAIHVADRLNEKYDAAQSLSYLAATGGVFHQLIPGVPVLVNAPDWQLTCGLAGQSSCASHGDQYQYETDATLDAMYHSGYLDGLSVATNLKNNDPGVQQLALARARARWPEPFLLWATCSQLSFPDQQFAGTPAPGPATDAYMLAPINAGANGVALWAWHQLYAGQIDTFLNKDGSGNAMWSAMTTAAAEIPGIANGQVSVRIPPPDATPTGPAGPAAPRSALLGAAPDTLVVGGVIVLGLCALGLALLSRRRSPRAATGRAAHRGEESPERTRSHVS